MQYDIPLPKEVKGHELVLALTQVASHHGWLYQDEVVACSVTLKSGSLNVQPYTLQVIIDPK